MTDKPANARRKAGATAWQPGQSGNPNGKKPGTRHRATQVAEAMLAGELEEVLKTVLEAAKGGDLVACRIVLDKVLPSVKATLPAISLPDLKPGAGLVQQAEAALQAAMTGQCAPDAAAAILSAAAGLARLRETEELADRLAAIEQTLKLRKD